MEDKMAAGVLGHATNYGYKGAHELCGTRLTSAFKLLTCQLRHVSIQYHVLLLHCTTTGRQSSTVHIRGIHGISVYKTHRIPRYIPCFTRLFVEHRSLSEILPNVSADPTNKSESFRKFTLTERLYDWGLSNDGKEASSGAERQIPRASFPRNTIFTSKKITIVSCFDCSMNFPTTN